MGASVRQKLLDHSRKSGSNYNQLLTRYAIERLLYRISLSAPRDRFVLKGAALYMIWKSESDAVNYRTTRDLDFWSSGSPDIEVVLDALREVVATPVEDDGITFDASTIKGEVRRTDEEYQGCKVEVTAALDGVAIRVLIDFGFGDVITPRARVVTYPTILAASPAPRLTIYPRETVIAEKFEAMVSLGLSNSRLKDFYDLWTLCQSFDFDGQLLSEAIRRTFERRQTALPDAIPMALTEQFSLDASKMAQWKSFGKRIQANDLPELSEISEHLHNFLLSVAQGAREGEFEKQWTPKNGWQPQLDRD